MRLVRYQTSRGVRRGLLDAAGILRDLDLSQHPLADQHCLDSAHLQRLRSLDGSSLRAVTESYQLLAPFERIGKIIGVGLNYRQHAIECQLPIPSEPTLFLKASSSLAGPSADLIRPRSSQSLDWEVELAVVIGKDGVYINPEHAMQHVAGYCLAIDFSERDFQFKRGGQGFKGKSCDSFCPLGPWFLTADGAPDPHKLQLELEVNDILRQQGNTADMIFSIPELVSYISQFMSLQIGDIILTGTPSGVGMGSYPPEYLNLGDKVVARGQGLGEQRHTVRGPPP